MASKPKDKPTTPPPGDDATSPPPGDDTAAPAGKPAPRAAPRDESRPAGVSEWGAAGAVADSRPVNFPYLLWINGKPDAEEGAAAWWGGFFLASDAAVTPRADSLADDPGQGWAPHKLRARKRDGSGVATVAGYLRRELPAIILRGRSAWRVESKAQGRGQSALFAWTDYDAARAHADTTRGKLRGVSHVLLLAQGIPEPVALVLKGTAGQGWTDRDGWHGAIRSRLLSVADRIARRHDPRAPALPALRFRVVIGVETDPGDGAPVFRVVGKGDDVSEVTRIALLDPAGPVDDPGVYFAGKRRMAECEGHYLAAEPWAVEWSPATLRPGYPVAPAPVAVPSFLEPGPASALAPRAPAPGNDDSEELDDVGF